MYNNATCKKRTNHSSQRPELVRLHPSDTIELLSSDDDIALDLKCCKKQAVARSAAQIIIDLDDSSDDEIVPHRSGISSAPSVVGSKAESIGTRESATSSCSAGPVRNPYGPREKINPPRRARTNNAAAKLAPPPRGPTKRPRAGADESVAAAASEEGRRLVLFEDDEGRPPLDSSARAHVASQRNSPRPRRYTDADFPAAASSIDGKKRAPRCGCSKTPAEIAYASAPGPNRGAPYYRCGKNPRVCKYFRWALRSELTRWYRFGTHSGHALVSPAGFRADDLLQGKVGDCWFLSALAVVAERPDLIARLFRGMLPGGGKDGKEGATLPRLNRYGEGIVEVTLFVDGVWTGVTVDDFLPCLVDEGAERDLDEAVRRSLGGAGDSYRVPSWDHGDGRVEDAGPPSDFDPFCMSDVNWKEVVETNEFLCQDKMKKGVFGSSSSGISRKLNRPVTTADLAYSKGKHNQLWVPFLEKAYSKVHGCYRAISGGHIAEAFLDLTGAPTLVYNFDAPGFDPKLLWTNLMRYRQKRLPMGCGTTTSQAGIVGMHAYSILDVREVRNIGMEFFRDEAIMGMGNVSGFTHFDGTVRLLRIRNPHGKGEWKGNFSDKSGVWDKLFHRYAESSPFENRSATSTSVSLERTHKNDGVFWIDYDSFLMGFSNVDVVLAFQGNHARSFASNFPAKKCNRRCVRAFEVSLLEIQPGVPSRDAVELYVMGIQKNRRGASSGRSDRKVSYKVSDLGFFVGSYRSDEDVARAAPADFDRVRGRMLGFRRDGHVRIEIERRRGRKYVIMPVSFGHPAATDKDLSFVLRFVADAPVLIQELPSVPKLNLVVQKYCLEASHLNVSCLTRRQGLRRVILEDTEGIEMYGEPLYRVFLIDCLAKGGGTAFVYIFVNEVVQKIYADSGSFRDATFTVEANCRGMICRSREGLLAHETVSKGKKFEAAWRKYKAEFYNENQSRLLMVLAQSGQDTQLGSVKCTAGVLNAGKAKNEKSLRTFFTQSPESLIIAENDEYDKYGIFAGMKNCIKDTTGL